MNNRIERTHRALQHLNKKKIARTFEDAENRANITLAVKKLQKKSHRKLLILRYGYRINERRIANENGLTEKELKEKLNEAVEALSDVLYPEQERK